MVILVLYLCLGLCCGFLEMEDSIYHKQDFSHILMVTLVTIVIWPFWVMNVFGVL